MIQSVNKQQGFSLVETLVAITILLIIVTGPITMSLSAAHSAKYSNEQIVAFFLAQEGAELAQKVRDDIVLSALAESTPRNGWSDFIETTGPLNYCYQSSGCGLATDSSVVINCAGTNDCLLYYDASNNRTKYTYTSAGSAVATAYKRKIYFEEINPSDIKVVSEVTWRTGNLRAGQTVRIETHLFDYGF